MLHREQKQNTRGELIHRKFSVLVGADDDLESFGIYQDAKPAAQPAGIDGLSVRDFKPTDLQSVVV